MEALEGATALEKSLLNQAALKRVPINGVLELLPLCNMNCDMCYVRLSREEMEKQGRLRTADEWLEIAKEMQKQGLLFLLLTGGEPLLYPGFKYLYTELQKLGIILTVNSNGTLINEEWAEFFGKHRPRRINITLYGADEKAYQELCHYPEGFGKTINAIRLLRAQGVDVKISGSLTKLNGKDVERMVAIGNDLDVPVRIDTYMMPAVRERNKPYNMQSRLDPVQSAQFCIQALKLEMPNETYKQFIEQSIREIESEGIEEEVSGCMTCRAGKASCAINWQGEMRPCVILSNPTVNVFETGFERAWKYIVDEVDKIRTSAKCNACKLKPLCRTCAASALLETGSFEGTPDYMCKYAEESLRLVRIEMERIRHGRE